MVLNRDEINRTLGALESKIQVAKLCVSRNWSLEDFMEILNNIKTHCDFLLNKLGTGRNDDIMLRNIGGLQSSINPLFSMVKSNRPTEDYIKLLESAEEYRQSIDDAIQREPLEGREINKI